MKLKFHFRILSIARRTHVASHWILALAVLLASCSVGLAQSLTGQSAPPAAAPAIAPPAAGQTAPSATNEISSQPMSMLYPGEDFSLQPGDLISVRVFLQGDYQATVRIGADGTAQLPFIGSVPLQGLTVRAAQSLIADRLRTGQFYRDPDVIIQVMDTVNGSVLITGELHATVPVATERSLKDVLLTAGGLPPSASHTVKIVRPGSKGPIVIELGTDLAASETADFQVQPHDIIQITRASVVYVLGAFRTQGAVPLDQASPLTLMQLAALSGGVGYEGKYSDLRLIRTVGNDRKVVSVDIKKVLNGKANDPILQANDIVFLPTDAMKATLKSLGIGGVLGIVSLLIATHAY
jgi:polysaccharide biosynthesis/export protein